VSVLSILWLKTVCFFIWYTVGEGGGGGGGGRHVYIFRFRGTVREKGWKTYITGP
jgi:hypothetical protein